MKDLDFILAGDKINIHTSEGAREGKSILLNDAVKHDFNSGYTYASKSGFKEVEASSKEQKSVSVNIVNDFVGYFPDVNDIVIGRIVNKNAEFYFMDIGSSGTAMLNNTEFEGGTKKNRPVLKINDLVHMRVTKVHKYSKVELSCISPFHKKAWNSGEAFFGPIVGGYLFECPKTLVVESSLLKEDSYILERLATIFKFEIAVGMNGRVWVNGDSIKSTFVIMNAILDSHKLTPEEIDASINSIHQQI